MRWLCVFVFLCINTYLIFGSTIVFFGDSLTAGYNIAQKNAFPQLIEQKITTDNITIINAGVSGDTTFNLLNRLNWTIEQTQPDVAFLCIGANDGLRGYDLNTMQSNLQTIIDIFRSHNITVILSGMSLPQNYSSHYVDTFETVFKTIAAKNHILFYPFLLQGVAGNDALNLSDRIHPNSDGHRVIADQVFEFLVSNNIIMSLDEL